MREHYKLIYLFSFIGSLTIHFSAMEWPVNFYFNRPQSQIKPQPYQKVQIKFVDSYNEDKKPDKPSSMISNHNNIASQPEKPKENLPDKSLPHIKKQSNRKEIKTSESYDLSRTQGKTGKIKSDKVQQESPQNKFLKKTVLKKAKQELIKKDDLLKKDTEVNKTPAAVNEKTIDSPQKTAFISKKDSETIRKQTLPEKNPVQGEDSDRQTIEQPDSKIDELIHNASSDAESVSQIIDLIKFDLTKHELGDYYAAMKRKISRNWKTRVILNYSTQMFSSEALIVFRIEKDGSISELKCLDYRGNPFFRQDCESAVKDSANLDPIPETYIKSSGKKNLWVYINFGYNTE